MTGDASRDAEGERTLSRRRLLAGAASAGAAAATPAFAGTAAAQSDSDETKTTPVALQNTAPKFGNDDYTGLFVQVTGYDREASRQGVTSCSFAGNQENITGYDAHLIDATSDDNPSEPITMFAVTEGTNVQVGKLFVVSEQSSSCSGGYVTAQLEEVGSSSIEVPSADGGSAAGSGSGSDSEIPGFGVLAGALGLGTASAAAAARSDD